jgi:hypothetical protein
MAVPLGVVHSAGHHRIEQGGEVVRIHLRVAGHHRHGVDSLIPAPFVSRGDGAADALVGLVLYKVQPIAKLRLVATRNVGRAVLAAIVDHHDVVHVLWHRLDYAPDQDLFVVRRHHDG